MIRGYKFRIYPNKTQTNLIQRTFGCCRFIYNQGLDFRQKEYEASNKKVGYSATYAMLKNLKDDEDFDWLNEVDSTALQQSLRDLDSAYKRFFQKLAKYPKFKSKHDHSKSYRSQAVNNNVRIIDSKHIKLPKLGTVKARVSRIPVGKINNATVEQTPSGKYFAVLNIETEDEIFPNNGGIIGIDVGLKDFYITSDGYKCNNPKYLKESLKKLRKEQKILSRRTKGSVRWDKQRIKVARLHEYITNQRNDFLQKKSTKLVKENQIISIEDLNVKGMVKNHKLARFISDVSWSKFFDMLEYKAYSHGAEIIKVPRFYASSQTCNCCGKQFSVTKDLSVRQWVCPHCGTTLDRDINAARNIRDKGLEVRKQELGIA